MRGHIRQRSKGSWEITYELPRAADGRRRQKTITYRGTKREAQQELARILHELHTGAHALPSRLTVAQFLDRWLEDYARTNVSAKTFEVYRNHIRTSIVPSL